MYTVAELASKISRGCHIPFLGSKLFILIEKVQSDVQQIICMKKTWCFTIEMNFLQFYHSGQNSDRETGVGPVCSMGPCDPS